MNLELFIAKRIIFGKNKQSKLTKSIGVIAVLGISIGVAIMILTFSVATGFQKEVKEKITGFSGHIIINANESDDSHENTPVAYKQNFYPSIKSDPEILHIQPYATKPGILKTKKDMQGVILKGVDKDFDWAYFKSNLIEGDLIDASDTCKKKEILISEKLSNQLELEVGKKIMVHFITKNQSSNGSFGSGLSHAHKKYLYTVKGIYNTGMAEEIDDKFALVNLNHIRKLNGWKNNEVGGFEIFLKEPNFIESITNTGTSYIDRLDLKVSDINFDYALIGSELAVTQIYDRFPNMMYWLDYLDTHIIIIIIIILIVSIINMSSALLIIILEKTQMIGILKSFGMQNWSLRSIFIYQSVFLIGQGVIFGNILGIGLCYIQDIFEVVKLDPEAYYLTSVPVNINLFHIVIVNVVTLIVCSIMLILPSYIISKISPVKAIRFA